MRQRTVLFSGLLLLLLLAACGPNRTAGTIESFGAVPLDNGDGSWRLEWQASSTEVLVDGIRRPPHASFDVEVTDSTTFTLSAGSDSRSLTLAPADSIIATAPAAVHPGMTGLEFAAVVTASGSDREPSQQVLWSSSDESVLVFDADTATVLTEGAVTVTATSAQYGDLSAELTLDIVNAAPAVIDDFSFSALPPVPEAGDVIEISWSVSDAETARLVEVVTGGTERNITVLPDLTGSMELQLPTDKQEVNYLLIASNIANAEATATLFSDPLPLPGWVCSDSNDVITFADPFIEDRVRTHIYGGLIDGAEDILCGHVQVGPDYFTPLLDEYGREIHHWIDANRCDQVPGEEDPLISSLEGLQHLTSLVRLELECNEISDISRLSSMVGLQELNLDRNNVSDLSPLAGLVNLRVLGLYWNDVADITPLAGLENLEIAYLSENRIMDVTPLAGLNRLRHVWLYLNCQNVEYDADDNVTSRSDCLQDITPLAGLTGLESLVFHMNDIADLSFLGPEFEELQMVFATGNRLRSTASFEQLPALRNAYLDSNLLDSLAPLAANASFPAGPEPWSFERGTVVMPTGDWAGVNLTLHDNCLDTTQPELLADLDAIEARGATVTGFYSFQDPSRCVTPLGTSSVDSQARDSLHTLEQFNSFRRTR